MATIDFGTWQDEVDHENSLVGPLVPGYSTVPDFSSAGSAALDAVKAAVEEDYPGYVVEGVLDSRWAVDVYPADEEYDLDDREEADLTSSLADHGLEAWNEACAGLPEIPWTEDDHLEWSFPQRPGTVEDFVADVDAADDYYNYRFDNDGLLAIYARNAPALPEDILDECLAPDAHPGVRKALAENPVTPVEIIVRLAEDEDSLVREAASKRLAQS